MLIHQLSEHTFIDYLLSTKDSTRTTGAKEEKQEWFILTGSSSPVGQTEILTFNCSTVCWELWKDSTRCWKLIERYKSQSGGPWSLSPSLLAHPANPVWEPLVEAAPHILGYGSALWSQLIWSDASQKPSSSIAFAVTEVFSGLSYEVCCHLRIVHQTQLRSHYVERAAENI